MKEQTKLSCIYDQNYCNVNTLPSRKVYAAFEQKNGKHHQCDNISTWIQGIEEILGDNLRMGAYSTVSLELIAGAWCLLSKVSTENPPCKVGVLCDFFYFWLGDQLHGKLSGWNTSLPTIMQQIYTKLGGNNGPCSYGTIDNTNDGGFLQRRKKVFDYYYDYRTIWKQLMENDAPCSTAYGEYLKDAQDAYGRVQANCPTNNDDFCKEFWNKKFQNGTIPKPEDLKSKAASEQDLPPSDDEGDEKNLLSCLEVLSSKVATVPKETSSHLSPASPEVEGAAESSRSIAPIVSSTLAALGLPAAVFLLYKYTNLFSGIDGTFPKERNKRKRGSPVERHFNKSSVDDDDTLTTTEETSSTVDSSTITDSITEYSAPPSNRRRTNNRKGHQQQRQRKTNISYHNM
ncbi:KIR protein [Plasmodium coatneyi]|uniref:KIR protein n=1 Tax=Plasmodium coatneyi TaxID=208452 RepID=A0A1B1E6C4_9APIC|nr:KIR protein [Plasmodium coatneyi]ANQ10561.1 KIR protein [Plasmodium coatneyi]